MQKNISVKKFLAFTLALTMVVSLFSGLGIVTMAKAADDIVFPAIYPASAIKPMDWDDPKLDALAWGVVNALTTAELYDLQGGSNTNRGRNPTGTAWEDAYTWGTGYVHMVGALGVPVMRFWDGPQGVVTVGHFDTTLPPSEPAASATWDRDAMYKYGTSYGRDNKAASANVQLGSQLDVIRSTHFSRSRDTLSEDSYHGAQMAVQFVKGMEDQNVMATLKHVCGYNFNTGTGRDVRVDEQTFHENWMAAPRASMVEGGASAIMSSYNRINLPFFSTWTGDPNATPNSQAMYPLGPQAALCDYMLIDCLRNMYGYQGITMTDWGGNTAFSGFLGTSLETGTISRNTQAAFQTAIAAGQGTLEDVRMNAFYNLKAMGKIGYLGLVQLDENGVAIRGTIEGGYTSIELAHPLGKEREDILWGSEELNLEVETKGAVLLKNSNNALPLKDAADKKVAVIGLSGQYALTSHYSEASAGWVQGKFSPLEKIDEMMPLSDVKGYIGANDIVGVPIPAELLWSEIERPVQPEYSGDYDGVTPGVNLTVGDAATASATMTNTTSKVLPDLKVLTGTNDYKNGPGGNGIVKGKAGRVVTYLKAPADGVYGLKILNVGGTAFGNSRISLLGDDMSVESFTAIGFTACPNFGRGTNIPAGSGYGTSSDVATREGMNIATSFTNVTLIKDRWYMIETGMWTTLNAKDAQFQINWLPGGNTDASRAAAVAAAGVPGTDVIFFAHQRSNGGGANSATTNTLPAVQTDLLRDVSAAARAVGNKVIFVGNISLAVSMPWLDQVDAVLWMWLGGDMVGVATAQLLTGAVNPSGKTNITFPKDSQQSQFGSSYVQNGNIASPGTYSVYFEGIYGGYKWYDLKNPGGVLFPFGYGLSYTSFEYSNLKVEKTPGVKYGYTVSVDVQNTGAVTGGEAVQVYLSSPKGYEFPTFTDWIIEDVQIAKKALVQFDKVYLAPGEKKTVVMDVNWEQLMFWDVNAPLRTQPDGTRGKWQPVLGERTFMVGGCSDNLPLAATVNVELVPNEGEFAAGITGPAVLDTVLSTNLSYDVTVNNVTGTNVFEIEAKFDNTKLDYIGSVINIPAIYNPTFLNQPEFNAATGVYKASILLLRQGTLWTIEDPTKILTVNFEAKDGVKSSGAHLSSILGELTSFMVSEALPPDEVDAAYAVLTPFRATTVISNQWRFDVNKVGGDGFIDILDLSWIIDRYYLAIEADANWNEAKAFDCNNDGIINLADLLIIGTYFTR